MGVAQGSAVGVTQGSAVGVTQGSAPQVEAPHRARAALRLPRYEGIVGRWRFGRGMCMCADNLAAHSVARHGVRMAVILAHVALKGGSGKTMTAVQVACALALDDKVLLLDLDASNSASALEFSYDREQTNADLVNPMILSVKNGQGLEAKIDAFSADYEWIILDGPPENAALTRRLMMLADLVILPVVPTPQVVKSLRKRDADAGNDDNTLDTFVRAKELRPELRLAGVFTQFDARQSVQVANLERARGYIEDAGGKVLSPPLTYICPYNEAWEDGLGVVEIKARTQSERRAQAEVNELVKQIKIALEEEEDGEQSGSDGSEDEGEGRESSTPDTSALADGSFGRG